MSASLVSVFIDGGSEPLLKCPFSPGVIPDESKAMSLLAPANAVAGMMPGGGLLPTPNPLATVSSKRFNVSGVYLQAGFLLNSPFIVASDGRNAIRRPRSSKYGADRCHGNTGTQHEPPGGRRLYSMFSACRTDVTYSFKSSSLSSSGSFCRLPEAHAVHGSKVRNVLLLSR